MRYNPFSADKIVDGIWLGDFTSSQNLPPFITHVISLLSKKPRLHPYDSNRKHLFICAEDRESQDLSSKFKECYDFIRNALKENNTNQVLIHCRAGKSRSATIAMMYLMRRRDWNYRQAKKYLMKKRPIIGINKGFKKQLRKYELQINVKTNRKNTRSSSSENLSNPIKPTLERSSSIEILIQGVTRIRIKGRPSFIIL